MTLKPHTMVFKKTRIFVNLAYYEPEMETGRVAGRVEILRPAGQAG